VPNDPSAPSAPALPGPRPPHAPHDERAPAPTSGRRLGLWLLAVVPLVTLAAVLLRLRGGSDGEGPGAEPPADATAAFFLSTAVVLTACHTGGALAARLRQPRVIGEIGAGLALGPSLLGHLAPGAFDRIFPATVLAPMQGLARLGLVLFMFGVGRELAAMPWRGATTRPLAIAQTSLLFPLATGTALALPLAGGMRPDGVPPGAFALFVGCALSVTALPVLARVLTDTGLLRTRPGRLSLFAAAVGDAASWMLLAVVISVAHGSSTWTVTLTALGAAGVTAVFLGPLRRAGAVWASRGAAGHVVHPTATGMLAVLAIAVTALAAVTSALGIHELIGALLVGIAWPAGHRPTDTAESLATGARSLLLPFFFFTFGLTVDLSTLALDGPALLALSGLFVAAVLSKLTGPVLCARLTGLPWHESWALGVLLNTRGLTELVVLRIGYEAGLIGGDLLAVLTVVALLTTAMTGPLLALTGVRAPPASDGRAPAAPRGAG
jgi:Kef-type K+ transport system membrane component KefB